MKRLNGFLALLALSGLIGTVSSAQVVQLFVPDSLGSERVTLSFDGYANYTIGNGIYQNLGITFSRDDGAVVPILDAVRYGYQVPSPDNIIFSGFYPEVGPTQAFTTHITVNSLQPLTEIGAFFGNDNYFPEFAFQRLSIFGATSNLLGSIDVAVNNNGHFDQFIGLRSDVPFFYARFENFTPSGAVSAGYGVGLDDFVFTAVPEPSTWALLSIGCVCGWFMLRRRSHSLRQK